MKKQSQHIILLLFIVLISIKSNAQKFELLKGKKSYTTSFKFINNLIIIPIEVNGAKLTFILDSGVSKTVLFNLKPSDTLELNTISKIYIRGLGSGEPIEAMYSKNNRFKLGNIYNGNQDLFIVYEEKFDLSAKLGITIHGLIGYDILKDFVVTINYSTHRIKFTHPSKYKYKKCRKCEVFDLEFHKNKPFINAEILNNLDTNSIPVKLLIDLGGSDSIWLFEDKYITVPKKYFDDFIGEGISGSIYGKRSKLKSFSLKSFVLKSPNVAYLDSLSSLHAKKFQSRNGSVGGNILKRFKIILDYPNSKLTLKKNRNFKEKFEYNMSGIELMYDGSVLVKERIVTDFNIPTSNNSTNSTNTVSFTYNYKYKFKPIFKVSYIRKNSPAEEAGVKVDDIIVRLNGKLAYKYDLQEIIQKFYNKKNKRIKLQIDRNGRKMEFQFDLREAI